MGKTPTQHWCQPGLQASQSPERAVVEARAASMICRRGKGLGVRD